VENGLAEIAQESILAGSAHSEEVISNAFLYKQSPWTVEITEKNLMGFSVPSMAPVKSEAGERDGLWAPSPPLAEAALKMQALIPKLLELAQVEKTCMLLSQEIEKVRRRVNALEYMTIPQLRETIRYIKMKLEDTEREGIIRMIKGKSYSQ
jgi:V/A-type H+-transporting ATPase subunit D